MSKKELDSQENENKIISLDTMANVGKDIEIAGRTYTVCPVNIRDMHLVLNAGNLYIPLDDKEGEEDSQVIQLVGMNVTDEKMSSNFFYVIEKYVFYKKQAMSKELMEEHGWSFKDIKKFLMFWAQVVSD